MEIVEEEVDFLSNGEGAVQIHKKKFKKKERKKYKNKKKYVFFIFVINSRTINQFQFQFILKIFSFFGIFNLYFISF
jgi:hypothetical protein